MSIMQTLQGVFNKDCKIFIDDVEESALQTIQSILDDEVSNGVPVRIMPDCHDGIDIVIGFTMPITDRINPNHVGVDIGCGVMCVVIDKLDIPLSGIDEKIRSVVPMGFSRRTEYDNSLPIDVDILRTKLGLERNDVISQIGTLGGGNHFVELGEYNDKWFIFIHTGSRNFGLQVCKYHSNKAKANGSKYLFGTDMMEYIRDVRVAQNFAKNNREVIAWNILEVLGVNTPITFFETIHNYIDTDSMIIRKGAVSAKLGERLVIPMNMRDGVLICAGKGNTDWNHSAPHGAGRIYARNKAKKELSMEMFTEEMKGVYSSSVCSETLDESPMAYKNMQTIIDCIGDTVDVEYIVKPILNIKAL